MKRGIVEIEIKMASGNRYMLSRQGRRWQISEHGCNATAGRMDAWFEVGHASSIRGALIVLPQADRAQVRANRQRSSQ